MQLPVYVPNKAEQADARLYADNVRAAMLRFGNFQPSESNLVECRAYIALLEGGCQSVCLPVPPHIASAPQPPQKACNFVTGALVKHWVEVRQPHLPCPAIMVSQTSFWPGRPHTGSAAKGLPGSWCTASEAVGCQASRPSSCCGQLSFLFRET